MLARRGLKLRFGHPGPAPPRPGGSERRLRGRAVPGTRRARSAQRAPSSGGHCRRRRQARSLSVLCPSFVRPLPRGRARLCFIERAIRQFSLYTPQPRQVAGRQWEAGFKTSVLCSHSHQFVPQISCLTHLHSHLPLHVRWYHLRVGCLNYSVLNHSQSTTYHVFPRLLVWCGEVKNPATL